MKPQNKNNNAYTAADHADRRKANAKDLSQSQHHCKPPENKSAADKKEDTVQETKMKKMTGDADSIKEDKQKLTVKSGTGMQKGGKNTEIIPDSVKSNTQSFQQKKPELPSVIQTSVFTGKDEEIYRVNQSNSGFSTSHGKITRNVTSRFGMKTFTVVPPKPTVVHASTTHSAATLTTGAIKIDDQGNMVRTGISWSKGGESTKSEDNEVSPHLEKAKTFWGSNERQEKAVTQRKGLGDEGKESLNGLCSTPTDLEVSNAGYHKTTQNALSKPVETAHPNVVVGKEVKEPVVEKVANKELAEVKSKVSESKNVQGPSNKPALPPVLLSDLKKDLSFLKQSRRTSSQYVASAITKYAPKTSAKSNSIPKIPDVSASQPTTGFQRVGRSIQVTSLQSSQSSSSDNKENVSTTCHPKRSMSYPDYMSDGLKDCEEETLSRRFEKAAALNKERSDMLDTAKNNHSQSSESTQIKMAASNNQDYIKHVQPRSPSPVKSSVLQPSSKPPTAPKITSQGQISVSETNTYKYEL